MGKTRWRLYTWTIPAIALLPGCLPGPVKGQVAAQEAGPGRSSASVPEAIVAEGVPEIPDDLWRDLEDYQDVRPTELVDWLPDGGIVVACREQNVSQLYRVERPAAERVPWTRGAEPVTEGVLLPDGRLLFLRAEGGDESYQLYLRPAGGDGEERLLTDGKSRHLLGALDRPRSRIAFTSTARNGRDADVFLLTLSAEPRTRLLFEVKEQTWSLEGWSEDGREALVQRYVSANESHVEVLDLASGERRPLPAEGAPESISRSHPRFGPGGRSIYLASDAAGERKGLARLDRAAGLWSWLTSDLEGDVVDFEVSPDRKQAALLLLEEGLSRLFLLDLERLEAGGAAPGWRHEVALGRCVARGLRYSHDSRQLGFTLETATVPAEAYSVERSGGTPKRWTLQAGVSLQGKRLAEVESFRYPTFDGRSIPAFIWRPVARRAGDAPAPVAIQIHGGPESLTRPGFSSRRQLLATRLGVAVIAPNVRGSTGYGKSFSRLDDGLLREDAVKDIGALLDWIVGDPALDPGRVAVLGGSYGGYMTLASLVHFPGRLRAGVESVGISNFRTFLENTSPYRRDLRRSEYGDERLPEIREFFERISPARRIGELRSALLVSHGENDPRVPVSEAKAIIEGARATGQPVWTLFARNEGHGFRRRENADYEEAAMVVFLQRHLIAEPVVDLEPTEASGPVLHRHATELFEEGRFAESAREFERAVRAGGAHSSDACWERGLARYYAGDPAGGRAQFEGYHRVGPEDIENGLWLYLCAVEAAGRGRPTVIEAARRRIPSYPQRRRTPFPELLDVYLGRGEERTVMAAAEGLVDPAAREEAIFYAHLYLGKHLEALGDDERARAHLAAAAARPVDHFMGWCASAEQGRR